MSGTRTNIIVAPDPKDEIAALTVYQYNYAEDTNVPKRTALGLNMSETYTDYPDAVVRDDSENNLSINMRNLVYSLLIRVQDMQRLLDNAQANNPRIFKDPSRNNQRTNWS